MYFELQVRFLFSATPGPKIETLSDFWRMIYLHDVKAIVMLTNLVENGVKKCQQYWPSAVNKPITYGDCQVTLVEEVVISDYVMRRFDLVVHSGTDNKKQLSTTVSHYYYQKWLVSHLKIHNRDDHFYLFALFKALYIKLVRTSKIWS